MEPLLSVLFFVASGFIGVLVHELDELVDPVDRGAVPTRDLDALEQRLVEWVFVRLAGRLPAGQQVISTRDSEDVRKTCNDNIAALESARSCVREYGLAKTNLYRSLIGCAVMQLPLGGMIAASVSDALFLGAGAPFLMVFSGFLFTSAYASLLMHRARRVYTATTNSLTERIGVQALIRIHETPSEG